MEAREAAERQKAEQDYHKFITIYDQLRKDDICESEDTDQLTEELNEIKAKIRYMMAEIEKAKQLVKDYEKKFELRLEKKKMRKILEHQKDLESEKHCSETSDSHSKWN